MTTDDLKRAGEIQDEIHTLQVALSQLNVAKMFSCDETQGCYRGQRADAFLSEVHVDIKNIAVKKIAKKISDLEKEFKSL